MRWIKLTSGKSKKFKLNEARKASHMPLPYEISITIYLYLCIILLHPLFVTSGIICLSMIHTPHLVSTATHWLWCQLPCISRRAIGDYCSSTICQSYIIPKNSPLEPFWDLAIIILSAPLVILNWRWSPLAIISFYPLTLSQKKKE
jgi:hypothetical protein